MKLIKELSFSDNVDKTNSYASLTADGKMVINKQSEFYSLIKGMMTRIMPFSDDVLDKHIKCTKGKKNLPSWGKYEEVYLCILEWEKKRRTVKSQYVKGNKKPFDMKGIIKNLFKRKAGERQ